MTTQPASRCPNRPAIAFVARRFRPGRGCGAPTGGVTSPTAPRFSIWRTAGTGTAGRTVPNGSRRGRRRVGYVQAVVCFSGTSAIAKLQSFSKGAGDLNVAVTLGTIRDHQLDVTAGHDRCLECARRLRKPRASRSSAAASRSTPSSTPRSSRVTSCAFWFWQAARTARFPPCGSAYWSEPYTQPNVSNVSEERQQGLQARFGDQYRLYLDADGREF